ncbi:hypothetical protein, partial [Kocuria palustris]|uniref:hypothetical protein n=1 Tax=Kocuria palustris TaxID=71999 RepID=UPI001F4542F4
MKNEKPYLAGIKNKIASASRERDALTHQLIQPNKKLLELVSADNLAHYRVLKQQTINQPVSPGPRRS